MKSVPPLVFLLLFAGLASGQPAAAPVATAGGDRVLLDRFVVTGTRTSRTLTDSPVKTDVFPASEIESRGGVTLADSLRLMPSVRFENDCQNCGLNQVQLLGLSTDYTAILFDGAPLYAGLAKIYGADIFPTIFIDRIEVVKGASSVLYGPEAIAGVVNLITEPPTAAGSRFTATRSFFPEGGSGYEGTFRVTHPSARGATALTVYGYRTARDGLDLTGDGFTELPEFRNTVVGFQFLHRPAENATFKTTYQFLDQAHRGGDRLDLAEEQARIAESLQHRFHSLLLDWRQVVTADFAYEIKAAYAHIGRDSFYGARADAEQLAYDEAVAAGYPGTPADFAAAAANQAAIDAAGRRVTGDTRNRVYFLDASVRRSVGAHELVGGTQVRQEKLDDSRPLDPALRPTFDQFSNLGLFLQDIWSLRDDLEVVPGLRADWHGNIAGTIYSPRLAVRYEPRPDLVLRASYAAGFNAPAAYNEDAHIGGTIVIRNDPGLAEERAQTLSAGVEWYPASLGRTLGLTSTFYSNRLHDTFEIDDTGAVSGDPDLWLRVNGPDSTVLTWETGLNWLPAEGLRVEASVSWIRARFDGPIDRVTGLRTREFIERPEWTGLLSVNHRRGPWESFVSYQHTGPMLATGEESDRWRRTPAFHEIDAGLARTFALGGSRRALRLGLTVRNLLDSYQDDLDNTGEARDVTYLYGPTRPRTITLSAGLQF
jgi:outer membrane receptor for ferrienterochelin and colicins